MAREHHCPNCGPQPCNASTSKIHTCGVCAAIWEEDLSAPVAAAPRPTAPATPAAATTTKPAAPPAPAPAAPKPSAPPAASAAPAAAPVAPKPAATPATAAPPPSAATPAASPAPQPAAQGPTGAARTLTEVVAAAKVKRCPKCQSDGVALPGDFRMVQGRVVLTDSQTYRAHEWYADTGELLPSAAAPPKPQPAAPAAPKTTPAT